MQRGTRQHRSACKQLLLYFVLTAEKAPTQICQLSVCLSQCSFIGDAVCRSRRLRSGSDGRLSIYGLTKIINVGEAGNVLRGNKYFQRETKTNLSRSQLIPPLQILAGSITCCFPPPPPRKKIQLCSFRNLGIVDQVSIKINLLLIGDRARTNQTTCYKILRQITSSTKLVTFSL